MVELDLDSEERQILLDLLETRLADLRMEVAQTSPMAHRDVLRNKKRVLDKTVAFLRSEWGFPVDPIDSDVPRF